MYIARKVSQAEGRIQRREIISLDDAASYILKLLFEDMLPLWATVGLDRRQGGFCEAIASDCSVPTVSRRVRVTARQLYVFSEAAWLGLNPAVASACILHGFRFLQEHSDYDGLIRHSISADGACLDAGHDLYDQAFLLLAWSSAYRQLKDDQFRQRAVKLLSSIRRRFGHVSGGFVDRTDRPFPLRANPHMHLLEAALSWIEIDDDPIWVSLADEIVRLFRLHFFDTGRGVVRETFTPDWRAIEDNGRCVVEPGHNYEWAWLLMRWEALTGGSAGGCAGAMINFAEAYGYDGRRHVAFNECWHDGAPHDTTARLWPQTERLKAWIAVAEASSGLVRLNAEARALEAARSLFGYIDPGAPGLWRDVMLDDGTFKPGVAPASSFYHIMCAAGELVRYVESAGAQDQNVGAVSIGLPPLMVPPNALLQNITPRNSAEHPV